jgi:hypothetical protein
MTSHWSIVERSTSRLVAQVKPYRLPSHWSNKVLQALVIISAFGPGVAAVVNGINYLPVQGLCHANKEEQSVMDCVETYSLWGRVVRRDRFQLVGIDEKKVERTDAGDSRLFISGLLWLFGISGSLAFFKARQTRKTLWTLTPEQVQQQPQAWLPRRSQQFLPAHSIQLEIPNIDLSLGLLPIKVCLQSVNSPTVNSLQRPEICRTGHHELAEVLESVLKPVSEVLDISCLLVFQQSQERYVVDFTDRAIQKFNNGEAIERIAFDQIAAVELEIPSAPTLTGRQLRVEQKSICYLTIELASGDRYRLHEYSGFMEISTAELWIRQLWAILQPHLPQLELSLPPMADQEFIEVAAIA